MVGADGPVEECQPAALAPTDHGLDDVAEKPTCRSAVPQFAAPLKVLPGDLEQILRSWESETVMSRNQPEPFAFPVISASPLAFLL